MSSEVTVYEKLSGIEAINQVGEILARSGMFGTEKVEQGKVLALACMTERQSPFAILRKYHLLHGRLTMRADAMLAEFKAAGGKCKWLSKLNDCTKAEAQFKYEENDLTESYTIEDAKREGLAGRDIWKKSTPEMLRARLVSKVLRMICPGIVSGVSEESEMPMTEAAGVDLSKAADQALRAEVKTAEPAKSETVKAEPAHEKIQDAEVIDSAAKAFDGNVVSIDRAPKPSEAEQVREAKVAALEHAFKADEKEVNFFLRKKEWIGEGQTFRDVSDETATLITARYRDFTAKAKEVYAAARAGK